MFLLISLMMAAMCFGMKLLLYFTEYQSHLNSHHNIKGGKTKMFHWFIVCCHSTECSAQTDNVLQRGGDVTATKGEAVTLSCEYNTSSTNAYLFWYKQDANGSPKFILRRVSFSNASEEDTAPGFGKRFKSNLDSSKRSVPLRIHKVQLSDSAVYYCALRPTVTGNTDTLYKNISWHIPAAGSLLLKPSKNSTFNLH